MEISSLCISGKLLGCNLLIHKTTQTLTFQLSKVWNKPLHTTHVYTARDEQKKEKRKIKFNLFSYPAELASQQAGVMIAAENIKREAPDWDEDDDEVVPKKRTRTKNLGGKRVFYSNECTPLAQTRAFIYPTSNLRAPLKQVVPLSGHHQSIVSGLRLWKAMFHIAQQQQRLRLSRVREVLSRLEY